MRKLKENILKLLVYLSAAFTVATVVVIVGYIFMKGISGINPTFLFSAYSASGDGGILPMIVTTLYTVILSILVATPIGVLAAIYHTLKVLLKLLLFFPLYSFLYFLKLGYLHKINLNHLFLTLYYLNSFLHLVNLLIICLI